jgi:hypothetical protein
MLTASSPLADDVSLANLLEPLPRMACRRASALVLALDMKSVKYVRLDQIMPLKAHKVGETTVSVRIIRSTSTDLPRLPAVLPYVRHTP